MEINELLSIAHAKRASDLHLKVGNHPIVRVNGELEPLADQPVLDPAAIRRLIESMLSVEQREAFRNNLELDLAYSVPGLSRYRVNIYQQRGSIGAALRPIPIGVPTIEELELPAVVRKLAGLPRGLVLVTGPTGSGKSTTLAAIINYINQTRRVHVVTIEDPIEYLHRDNKSIINQREIGSDTLSFANALKHVLRQDPDVILVGEMRDLETIATAVTAAETGHLVFATLHTQSAAQTLDRVIDAFPPYQQAQIKTQLSTALEGVMSQTLIPLATGRGRVAAIEVMLVNPAIRNLIREGKTHQIPSTIQSGAKDGMQTLNQSLRQLVESHKITYEDALARASSAQEFAMLLGRQSVTA
ncbi:MAG TPA: type IV pilus twitching motility protein PilT [bacterium]|jgi:twitching motility protein PilT